MKHTIPNFADVFTIAEAQEAAELLERIEID